MSSVPDSPGEPPTALIVARDPGAASALIPVARSLSCVVFGLDAARPVFERAGVPLFPLATDREGNVAEEWVRRVRPRVLVSGTSRIDLVPYDAQWWEAARSLEIPSVAVLDHWIGYWQKFTRTTHFDTLPDVIAVMDDYARDRLKDLGCRNARLVVTGHPGLDSLAKGEPADRQMVRDRWGVAKDDWIVLFASEPIAADHGRSLGYDEADALTILLRAIEGVPAQLVVKPHPREAPDRLAKVLRDHDRRAIVETSFDGRTSVAGADSVVGVTSLLLLEAGLLGRPVLSIQPGEREPWTEHFRSLITTVDSIDPARDWLTSETNRAVRSDTDNRLRTEGAGFDGHAVQRVCRLVHELAG